MNRDLRLIGFIADRPGNEARLIARDAIARKKGGSLIRYPAAGGPAETLESTLSGFVRPVPEKLALNWREGDVVWIAERFFVVKGGANDAVRAFLDGWLVNERGDRMAVGKPRELLARRDNLASSLSRQLGIYLFDSLERSHGEARLVFDLFLAVESDASKRRFLFAGLYHWEMRDRERFERQAIRAVKSGHFADGISYRDEIQSLRSWLESPRLHESGRASRAGGFEPRDLPVQGDVATAVFWRKFFDNVHHLEQGRESHPVLSQGPGWDRLHKRIQTSDAWDNGLVVEKLTFGHAGTDVRSISALDISADSESDPGRR